MSRVKGLPAKVLGIIIAEVSLSGPTEPEGIPDSTSLIGRHMYTNSTSYVMNARGAICAQLGAAASPEVTLVPAKVRACKSKPG